MVERPGETLELLDRDGLRAGRGRRRRADRLDLTRRDEGARSVRRGRVDLDLVVGLGECEVDARRAVRVLERQAVPGELERLDPLRRRRFAEGRQRVRLRVGADGEVVGAGVARLRAGRQIPDVDPVVFRPCQLVREARLRAGPVDRMGGRFRELLQLRLGSGGGTTSRGLRWVAAPAERQPADEERREADGRA